MEWKLNVDMFTQIQDHFGNLERAVAPLWEETYWQGLSTGVVDIILDSWRNSTKQHYGSYFKRWDKFYLPLVLDFLL